MRRPKEKIDKSVKGLWDAAEAEVVDATEPETPTPAGGDVVKFGISRDAVFEAHKLFHDVFHLSFTDYIDKLQTTLFKKPVVDMWKFDDWLHDTFGNYEDEQGLSMRDIIAKEYGEANMLRFEKLL